MAASEPVRAPNEHERKTMGTLRFPLLMLAWGLSSSLPIAADDMLDARTGQPISRVALLGVMGAADWVLFGERHDNPRHHDARAELLQEMRPGRVVIEHLNQGARLDIADNLDAALDRAGYNRKGWRWPMQQTLLQTLRDNAATVLGGNLSRADGRKVAMDGMAALDQDLLARIEAAPLTGVAQARLDADLDRGHCGHLSAERLPNMRLAQRARDAAMARTLLAETSPAVLLAGNGHVRLDYGVPVLLRAAKPQARLVSIGFVETGDVVEPGAYDYLWVTTPMPRPDPCAGFKMPNAQPGKAS
jgi:uncharacterized iron-regulated protein